MASIFWRLWIIKNYEYERGATLPCVEIIEKAKEVGPLSSTHIGVIINEVWGEQVIKRRHRSADLCSYENLKLKNVRASEGRETVAIHSDMEITVPAGWTKVSKDSSHVMKSQQCEVEITIEQSGDKPEPSVTLRSRNVTLDIDNEPGFELALSGLSLKRKVEVLQRLIETTRLCEGITVLEDENTMEYSKKCKMFVYCNTRQCGSCYDLNENIRKRNARRDERNCINLKTNKRYLSKSDMGLQLNEERKRRVNAGKKEMYWKNKFETELIEIDEQDHDDIMSIMCDHEVKEIPENLKCLWDQQKKILDTSSKCGYRWHPKIIRLCLDLYCKNPHVMEPLREFINLPSNRTIRLYKNKIEQSPGWNNAIMNWCKAEAVKVGLKEDGYWGGFVIDEMKIQEDLEMVVRNGKHRIVGFIDLGEGHEAMAQLTGKNEPRLASQVLQFIFLSDAGFRFPIAQFPSGDCSPSTLYMVFWDGVMKMREKGFLIYWCILDGADCNRQFIKLHFEGKNVVDEKFTTKNFSTGDPMVFLMDPKHNIKKIRKNIQKSNEEVKPRCLQFHGSKVTWKQFVDAYNWDQKNCSLPIHEQLTHDHFQLDSALKMRNHLAEDVLNHKMLYLMQKFQESLPSNGRDAKELESTVLMLQHTSQVISFFTDKLPISTMLKLKDIPIVKYNNCRPNSYHM